MNVIYEFDLDDEDRDDKNALKIFQNSLNMYLGMSELENIRRNLSKGYKYYDQSETEENENEEEKYQKINIDLLIEDIREILVDSNFYEME